MNAAELRAIQAPLKDKYKQNPETALVTLKAVGHVDADTVACRIERRQGDLAGLHPATGGTGAELCSGDMLLEALVACAGVTMKAVATAMGIPLRGATVRAEGDLDFRGTLGVDKTVPVGFRAIRLTFALDTDAPQDKLDTLLKLTERYCVVLQTLTHPPTLTAHLAPTPAPKDLGQALRNRSMTRAKGRARGSGVPLRAPTSALLAVPGEDASAK